MQPQLIALDLDGTLLDAEAKISPRNARALLAAEAAGITIVIATGRRHFYALKVLRGLALAPETPLVSSNGAIVRTFASALIERTAMDPAAARWLPTHIPAYRDALVLTFDRTLTSGPDAGQDTVGALVVENIAELKATLGKWVDSNEPYMLESNPIELALQEDADPPIQAMLCGPVARMRAAEALLLESPQVSAVGEARAAALIQLNRTEYPERDLSILDILPAGCSKGAAILRLAAARNIPQAAVMCLGDNWNDLSMLEIAGHPILMGNAPEDLLAIARQKAWHITAPHHQDGVAEAIERACPHLFPAQSSKDIAAPARTPSLEALEQLLGHRFQRPDFLLLALTHRSFAYDASTEPPEKRVSNPAEDNEQLEFVGDAVLGLIAAESVYRRYPASREGDLTRLRASVVSRRHLGVVGAALGLGRWLRLGHTAEKNQGRTNATLFANTMEALIAALYLDGGLEPARRFVEQHVLATLGQAAPAPDTVLAGDYKSALQELLQARGQARPEYRLLEQSGPDHRRAFRMQVWIDGQAVSQASAPTKKQAQQDAAHLALAQLRGPHAS